MPVILKQISGQDFNTDLGNKEPLSAEIERKKNL